MVEFNDKGIFSLGANDVEQAEDKSRLITLITASISWELCQDKAKSQEWFAFLSGVEI
jgi:hypothetical protein